MKKMLVLTAAFLATSGLAHADILIDQPNSGGNGRWSQSVTDMTDLATFQLDDFALLNDAHITTVIAYGEEQGNSGENLNIVAQIWSGLPTQGGSLVLSTNGVQNGHNLEFDFGGALLTAGSYWLTAYVERPLASGGQWFWNTSTVMNGNESYFYNPAGGFGLGVEPIPGSIPFGEAADLAFSIHGNSVPTPGVLALLGVAGLVARSRRRKA